MNSLRNFAQRLLAAGSTRLGRVTAALTLAFGVMLGLSTSGASASPPTLPPVPADPTGGAMSTTLDGVIDWVTTYGVPALAVGILTGILIRLGFKWVRRAGKAIG